MNTGRVARLAAISLSAAAAAAALAVPAAASAAATPGTAKWAVSGERDLGALSARPMKVTLVLTPRNASGLRAFVSSPHAALTPAQFNAQYAPSTSTVSAVSKWASSNGLTVGSVSSNRLLVSLSGSSASFAKAFNTTLHQYRTSASGTYFRPVGAAQLPAGVASSVKAVLGLSSLGKVSLAHPVQRSTADRVTTLATPGADLSSINYPASYGPQDLWSLYDAPASQTGSGQQLAIITEGDVSQPKQDLATFEQHFGLPTVTWNQINVGTSSTDTSGDDEWDLDSQYSTGFAPGVSQLNVYVGASLDDADILTTINRFVTDDSSRQGSFSAGECDLLADVAGFTSGLDAVLQQADAQGQTMFFSSGDTGSQCPAVVGVNGVPVGLPDTSYPASSPFGIGVGGTSVLGPGNEIAWYAGGGGLSLIEPTASFQSNTAVLGVLPLATRGVPDVSLDADPESGYDVVVGGTVETIGGTSASAPSWQGIWARVEGAHSGGLSFAGPILYSTEPSTAFNDITIGANGLYTAGPGYDLTTGLGTPNITNLVAGA